MAVKNVESLVLDGVSVATEVVTGLKRIGSNTANGQTPAMALSHSRHPSHSDCGSDPDARPRSGCAEYIGAALAVERAGRPGCCPGVHASRSLARAAGRTVLSGWPLATEVPYPVTPCSAGRFTSGVQAALEPGRFQRSQPYSARSLQRGGLSSRSEATNSGKRRILQRVWPRPCEGTPTASMRGKKV